MFEVNFKSDSGAVREQEWEWINSQYYNRLKQLGAQGMHCRGCQSATQEYAGIYLLSTMDPT